MTTIERMTGIPVWKLTTPPKLLLGLLIMLSGTALAAQNVLVG